MIITREQQEALLENYIKNNPQGEHMGFIDGMTAMLALVDRILLREKSNENG